MALPGRRPRRLHGRTGGRGVHRLTRGGHQRARPDRCGRHPGRDIEQRLSGNDERESLELVSAGAASGAANRASVPSLATAVPVSVDTVTPITYKSPECLDAGGVLVVGASATGVQLADEIQDTDIDALDPPCRFEPTSARAIRPSKSIYTGRQSAP